MLRWLRLQQTFPWNTVYGAFYETVGHVPYGTHKWLKQKKAVWLKTMMLTGISAKANGRDDNKGGREQRQ